MEFAAKIKGMGCDCKMHIFADDDEIGVCTIGQDSGIVNTVVKAVTGRHAVYFKISTDYTGWTSEFFKDRSLFELSEFVFMK